MANRIIPSSGAKSKFMMHVVVFIIANAAIWAYWYYGQGANHQWVYPWGIWLTAAWALSLIGHWCAVYTNYEDPGVEEFKRQASN